MVRWLLLAGSLFHWGKIILGERSRWTGTGGNVFDERCTGLTGSRAT
jgi:hypothetical protein